MTDDDDCRPNDHGGPNDQDRDRPNDDVAVEVADATIRATDDMDNTVEVETSGWRTIGGDDATDSFPADVDAVITGRVSTLAVDAKYPQLSAVDDDGDVVEKYALDAGDSVDLPAGRYHLSVEPPIGVSVSFPGPATVASTAGWHSGSRTTSRRPSPSGSRASSSTPGRP